VPEGDTLYKAAARLRVMVGEVVTRFESSVLEVAAVGRTVSEVEARGKNLLMWFDGTHALYTHLRMSGSWHLYRPGSEWTKAAAQVKVLVETESWVAVCFNAPVVEWLTAWEVGHHPVLAGLGPDLLDEEVDIEQAIARLRVNPERALGEAILDQRLVAGLGNVYKSELLFMERLDPFKSVGSYDDEVLRRLLVAGRRWMRRNVGEGPRRTRWDGGRARAWVYNRSGELCPRCGTQISMRRQGALGRTTYYCPRCQEVGGKPGGRGRVLVRGPAD
jgi:endonuclease-8